MIATNNGNEDSASADKSKIGLGHYLSAAFGGFLVGFAELLRSGSDSTNVTVFRVSAVLREQFSPALGDGWVALLLLAIFAMIFCAIYRPLSQKESFVLGFSVYAVLTAAVPQQEVKKTFDIKPVAVEFFSIISSAIAAEQPKIGVLGDYYFLFQSPSGGPKNRKGTMTVFDESEKHLLISVESDVSKIAKIRLPKGNYVLKFECKGCATIRGQMRVEKPVDGAIVTLTDSNIPLSLQRLFRPGIVNIEDVDDDQLAKIIEKYTKQQAGR